MLGFMLDTKNRSMNETQFLTSITEERKMYSTFIMQYRCMVIAEVWQNVEVSMLQLVVEG